MVGGQHRSDEVTRTERVGWTRIRHWYAQWEEAKAQKKKEKMKKPLDNGRPR